MKWWLVPALAFCLILGLVNHAAAILVTSYEYQISGNWTETSVKNPSTDNETLHTTSGSFSLSSTNSGPISTSIESEPYGFLRGSSSIYAFGLDMALAVDSSGFAAWWIDPNVYNKASRIDASAQGDWYFQVESSLLQIALGSFLDIMAPDPRSLSVVLADATTETVLLSRTDLAGAPHDLITDYYDIAVDPVHLFHLSILGSASAWNQQWVDFHTDVQMTAVPEPSTVLLLGSGLLGLAWIACRRHRK